MAFVYLTQVSSDSGYTYKNFNYNMIKDKRQKQRKINPRHTYFMSFYVTYDILNAIYFIMKHTEIDDTELKITMVH